MSVSRLQKAFALPTWLIVRGGRRFLPENHPFKQEITLSNWTATRTDLSKMFDAIFYVQIVSKTILLTVLLLK